MQFIVRMYKSACRIKEMFYACLGRYDESMSKMHMMTYIQTQTLLMYRQTIVDV